MLHFAIFGIVWTGRHGIFIARQKVGMSDGFPKEFRVQPVKVVAVEEFSNLADAATDYLLFSLGRGRWNPLD